MKLIITLKYAIKINKQSINGKLYQTKRIGFRMDPDTEKFHVGIE